MSEKPTEMDREPAGRLPWIGLAIVTLLGLVLRIVEARKSFWLDELHSTELAHASLGAMFKLLRPDFHAPIFFAFAGLADRLGLSGHALRVVPIAGSLLCLYPFLMLARQARVSPAAILAGAAMLLLAPYQIRYGAELRPYACLQLATLTAAWAVFDRRMSSRARFILFALAAALGLYSHYLAAVAVIAAGAARCLTPGGGRLPIWKVVAAGSLGVALFLPWILEVESWLVHDPGVLVRRESEDDPSGKEAEIIQSPGRSFAYHRDDLIALPGRTFAPGAASLGNPGRALVLGGLAMSVIVLLGGIAQGLVKRERRAAAALWGPVIMAVIAIVITAVLCVRIWERLPIQYFATGAFIWAPLAAIAVQGFAAGRARQIAALLLVLGALLGGIGEAIGAPREDIESAARTAVKLARSEDAHLTAILRQPGHYSNIEVYRVYAPGVAAVEPEAVPVDAHRVVVLTRSTPLEHHQLPAELVGSIEEGRVIVERRDFGGGIVVYVFGPKS